MNTPDVQNKTQVPRRRHWTRRSHRVLGVGSLLFLILIALSGLILNHADTLGLSRHAAGPMLLRIYGIEAPPVDSAFEANDILFATSSGTLFADGVELAPNSADLRGAIEIDDGLVVATGNEFFVTTRDATLVERFAPEAPGSIMKLGTDGQNAVVLIQNQMFEFDSERMKLSATMISPSNAVIWSQSATPSEEQAEQIGVAGLAQSMNWERVLIDFHSGRILPTVGRYIADITALCLLYLCMSGIVLWTRRR
ncbi:MAG: PepSY domain-containing protein [Woeseiaceae bacterium]